MRIDIKTGLIQDIAYFPAGAANSSERSSSDNISLLVIHDTEIVAPLAQPYNRSIVHYMFTGQYEQLKQTYPKEYSEIFPNDAIRNVSAHVVIRRSGEMIQYVPFLQAAHHAGVSEYKGQTNCNDFSIGIELEGYANRDDFLYTDAQYDSLAELTKAIIQAYSLITLDAIVGHEDIARPIGRKTDPGATFDWQRYRKLIL